MTYVATYKTKDGIELQEDLDTWYLEGALKEARENAKRNHWKLIEEVVAMGDIIGLLATKKSEGKIVRFQASSTQVTIQ